MKRFVFAILGCAVVVPAAWMSAPPAMSEANTTKNAAKPAAKTMACCAMHSHAKTTAKPSVKSSAKTAKKTPQQIKAEKVDVLWKKSDKAFHDGDYPQAVVYHRQIVALDPADVESYSVASWLLWSLGKGDEAVLHLQRGIKANPQNYEMWEALGNHYANFVKQPKAALFAYQRAVQLAPKNANTQMLRRQLAHAAEGSGDLNLSATTWRGLVKDYPQIAVNKNNLTRVEAKLGVQ
jgi:tetratricopeptide (TPR) repeat protein